MCKANNKKKAFTLTELLVVVIVIGVLSAAVLPKFSKVIETRKTTEAEELMASIRTEQEKRCALDKPYLTQMSELTDVVKTASTKNYQINLQDKGIKAASKGKYSYTLQMPSYADGRICCDGDDCEKLNKNYPSCTGFTYEPSPDSCAGTVMPVEPEIKSCSGSSTQACGCLNTGTQSRTCNTTTGEWSDWGACSVSDGCECTGTKPNASQDCNKCGTQTRSVTCDTATGEWQTGSWSTCSKTEAQCPKACTGESSRACGCDMLFTTAKKGTQTRTCDTTTGTWGSWGACTGFMEWDQQKCPSGDYEKWQCTYSSSKDSWSWKQIVACTSKCDNSLAQSCENPQNPDAQPGWWHDDTCTCTCQSQASLDEYGECVVDNGSSGGGEACTWQSIGCFSCGASGSAAASAACRGYSQCSVNDYCPGGGICAEACI